jgi:outer membrane protein assembly factor BamC
VLEQLSQYLADRTDIYSSSSASLLAGSLAGESKSSLVPGANGNQELNLRIGMTRAWAQIAQALERADITVVDSDRDSGVYNVLFAGLGVDLDEPGFFRRIFTRNDASDGDAIPQFSLHVEDTGSGIRVTVTPTLAVDNESRLIEELLQTVLSNIG